MADIFKSTIILSFSGALLTIILLLIKPLTKKFFSPNWNYYIWLTVLFVLILPVSFKFPSMTEQINTNTNTEITVNKTDAEYETVHTKKVVNESNGNRLSLKGNEIYIDSINILAYLWFVAVIVVFLYKIIKYNIFLKALYKNSCVINIKNLCIDARKTSIVDAPLIIGLFKPVLYIPDIDISEEKFDCIIKHELTHYKRGDILYKWLAMIVSCVHWFNPTVYLLIKQIDEECEISCDYIVTKNFNEQQCICYMKTILDLLANSVNKRRLLTTQMASDKKILKRRFAMIKDRKETKIGISIIGILTGIVIFSAVVFASGIINGNVKNKAETAGGNYDLIYDSEFDPENIKYSRDYNDEEIQNYQKMNYEYYWNDKRPLKSLQDRKKSDGLYFDVDENMVVYPKRMLNDDELLAIVEFNADINSLYRENWATPNESSIREERAKDIAEEEIIKFFGDNILNYNISCGYNEEEVGDNVNGVYLVMFEPINMPYLDEAKADYYVYFVDIDAGSGEVISVDSYYSHRNSETKEVSALSESDKNNYELKSREAMKNVVSLEKVNDQYISKVYKRTVFTVFESKDGNYKVELSYPDMKKVGWEKIK